MIGWFVAGLGTGLIVAAIVSGLADRKREWRKRRHEQKNVQNYFMHHGGGIIRADRNEQSDRQ